MSSRRSRNLQGYPTVKHSATAAGVDAGVMAVISRRNQDAWLELLITTIYSAALANDKLDDSETQSQKVKSTYNQQELPLREFLTAIWPEQPQRLDIKTNSADAVVQVSCL